MTDRFTVRTVVLGLVGAVLLCVVGVVVLALNDTDVPEILKAIALTALGAVAGVLSKTNTEVQPVAVVNKPADPVPTADVPAKRRKDAGHGDVGGILYIALVALVIVLILAIVGVI